jgi:hypothetical protein
MSAEYTPAEKGSPALDRRVLSEGLHVEVLTCRSSDSLGDLSHLMSRTCEEGDPAGSRRFFTT